jgi:hypothetical protein
MKKGLLKIIVGLFVSFAGMELSAETVKSSSDEQAVVDLLRSAFSSRVMIQNVAKSYLYAGNNIATTKAEKELETALKQFDSKYNQLKLSINDPKVANLLLFIESNKEEIGDLLKEKYSLENAQEIIDLAEAISEGELSIANRIKSKIKGSAPEFKGQRYYAAQVAKYYMAYKAGIKDKNTIKNMNFVVKKLATLIGEMRKYPGNTPKMNKLVNKIERQWKIVHKFYLDIEEGDLPLIVYDTTSKLDRLFYKYTESLLKQAKKK